MKTSKIAIGGIALLLLATSAAAVDTTPVFAGEGTTQEPFLIGTPAEFALARDRIAAAESYKQNGKTLKYSAAAYRLTDFLDFGGEVTGTPFGTSANPFTGDFDGDGYTMEYYSVVSSDASVGVFGTLLGGCVHDLTLSNVAATLEVPASATGKYAVGLLCGRVENATSKTTVSVERCTVEGTVTASSEVSGTEIDVGGMIGRLHSAGLSKKAVVCDGAADITVSATGGEKVTVVAGGVVGYAGNPDVLLKNLIASGSVNAVAKSRYKAFTGGIAGKVEALVDESPWLASEAGIVSCFSDCAVTSSAGHGLKDVTEYEETMYNRGLICGFVQGRDEAPPVSVYTTRTDISTFNDSHSDGKTVSALNDTLWHDRLGFDTVSLWQSRPEKTPVLPRRAGLAGHRLSDGKSVMITTHAGETTLAGTLVAVTYDADGRLNGVQTRRAVLLGGYYSDTESFTFDTDADVHVFFLPDDTFSPICRALTVK